MHCCADEPLGAGLTAGDKNLMLPKWLISAALYPCFRYTPTHVYAESALDAGWIFLSPNYRLIAPITGHDVLDDVKALFAWIKSGTNTALDAHADTRGKGLMIDAARLLATGSSAGGYLANLAGRWCEPRPKAVVTLYAQGGDYLVRMIYMVYGGTTHHCICRATYG